MTQWHQTMYSAKGNAMTESTRIVMMAEDRDEGAVDCEVLITPPSEDEERVTIDVSTETHPHVVIFRLPVPTVELWIAVLKRSIR